MCGSGRLLLLVSLVVMGVSLACMAKNLISGVSLSSNDMFSEYIFTCLVSTGLVALSVYMSDAGPSGRGCLKEPMRDS